MQGCSDRIGPGGCDDSTQTSLIGAQMLRGPGVPHDRQSWMGSNVGVPELAFLEGLPEPLGSQGPLRLNGRNLASQLPPRHKSTHQQRQDSESLENETSVQNGLHFLDPIFTDARMDSTKATKMDSHLGDLARA